MAVLFLVAACAERAATGPQTYTAAKPGSSAPVSGEIEAKAQDALVVHVGDRVFFDFDRSDLGPDAIDTLNRQASWLTANRAITVTVEGHCDERGTREYNLALGERRAMAAKQYLETMGIDGSRIATVSYGKERPAVLGSDEAARAQNRRVVMVVRSGELTVDLENTAVVLVDVVEPEKPEIPDAGGDTPARDDNASGSGGDGDSSGGDGGAPGDGDTGGDSGAEKGGNADAGGGNGSENGPDGRDRDPGNSGNSQGRSRHND